MRSVLEPMVRDSETSDKFRNVNSRTSGHALRIPRITVVEGSEPFQYPSNFIVCRFLKIL